MSDKLTALVAGALTNVRNPRTDKDVISAGMVYDLVVDPDGRVSFTFELGNDDPSNLHNRPPAASSLRQNHPNPTSRTWVRFWQSRVARAVSESRPWRRTSRLH